VIAKVKVAGSSRSLLCDSSKRSCWGHLFREGEGNGSDHGGGTEPPRPSLAGIIVSQSIHVCLFVCVLPSEWELINECEKKEQKCESKIEAALVHNDRTDSKKRKCRQRTMLELCEIERRRIPRIFIRMNESMDEFISHPIVSTYLKGGKE
jgi:hypothetical protein